MKPEERKQPGSKDPKDSKDSKDSGGRQQQQQGGEGGQYGEGNYQATRQYNEGLKDHVEHHDIERDARTAAPKNADEEREMEEAERIGRAKSKGEGSSPDGEPKR